MDHSEVKHLPKVDHTPAELDEASKLLLKAASLIETKGHAKGQMESSRGYCAWGALAHAESGVAGSLGPNGIVARQRLCDAIGREGIWGWNDDRSRTADEVISTMRRAAFGG